MKTYAITSWGNYGAVVYIVNEDSAEKAKDYAISGGAWLDSEVEEIDTNRPGIVFAGGGDR